MDLAADKNTSKRIQSLGFRSISINQVPINNITYLYLIEIIFLTGRPFIRVVQPM